MLDIFLVAFLGGLIGGFIASWCRGTKISHTTYISCPKGIPRNVSRIIDEHEEMAKLVKILTKTFLDEEV